MALQFTRNAGVYIELTNAVTGAPKAHWKLSVLDGFSFTQSINSSEITINEAGATSRRARLLFNDSLAPVEWSLSTYARPFLDTAPAICRAPEDVLWAMALGANDYATNPTTGQFSNTALNPDVPVNGNDAVGTAAPTASTNIFNLNGSNVSSFGDNWNMYFAFEDGTNTQYYKLTSAVVNSVSMDFDIDGIATISWSGFAKELGDEGIVQPGFIKTAANRTQYTVTGVTGSGATPNVVTALTANTTGLEIGSRIFVEGNGSYDTPAAGAVITAVVTDTSFSYEITTNTATGDDATGTFGLTNADIKTDNPEESGLTSTTNFIRNRISTVDLQRTDEGPTTYSLVLTGGSFTLENNINYLTPEELGVVNAPLANITGARSISGTMNCYLDNGAGDLSGQLFADLVADTDTIRNVFNMQLQMGGKDAGTPRVYLDLPTAHLEIPTINVEDLLTLEINFHGQVSGGDVDNTNEATIIYNV